MADLTESPFAVLDTVGDDAGDSAEATPAEAEPEEAPAEAKAEETPESEGEEQKAEEPAKPEAEPEKKEGEKKADDEAEEAEPEEGDSPRLKDFVSKHRLSSEEKRWLSKQVYTNREYRSVFPDIGEAKEIRAEVAELREVFPVKEDWRNAAEARDAFFRASEDFEKNPGAFRDGLKLTNPEAYARLVETVASDIAALAPKARLEMVSSDLQKVFSALKAEAQAQGLTWDQINAQELEDRIFPAEKPERADPRIEQILEENRRLKAEREGASQKGAAARTAALNRGLVTAIHAEAKQYVEKYAGDGFSDGAKAKVASDLATRVVQAYQNTPSNNHAKKAAIDALGLGQAGLPEVVATLAARSRPDFKRLGPDVIRNWTEIIVGANQKTVQRVREQKTENAHGERDVPQMGTPSRPAVDMSQIRDKKTLWEKAFG